MADSDEIRELAKHHALREVSRRSGKELNHKGVSVRCDFQLPTILSVEL
jgi:hypothetical protein